MRWGLSDVWGASTVSATRSVWKLATVSPDGTVLHTRSVWGVSILGAYSVWGTPSASGFAAVWSTAASTATAQTRVGDLSVALQGEN